MTLDVRLLKGQKLLNFCNDFHGECILAYLYCIRLPDGLIISIFVSVCVQTVNPCGERGSFMERKILGPKYITN